MLKHERMIRKSGNRLSEKIMLKQNVRGDDDSNESHRALTGLGEKIA